MTQLAEKRCIPCRGGVPPLTADEIAPLLDQLQGWAVVEDHHLRKLVRFPDFAEALAFVNQVGEIAEAEDHHPDIYLAWGKAEITLWTHKINGLTESDFVLAAKIDRMTAG
ncbi:MAG: 4a-hydroxytetrahydrobiopterin dehydratase [Candidatus Aminicenantes bacterium]|nr:4a-hydroxytetrahydrobiopterin dehydratase [Candidatus Aminicenantes bacterium]